MTRRKKSVRTFTHVDRQRLDRAADHYLRKCYRTKSAARASEFAMDIGLTPEYASWLAPKILGRSLRDFLREKQVAYAARLLEAAPPSVTVEEIALRSGFGTAGTLYRWFVAAHGMTPGEFRGLKK
jgi:AraC-like DNA-binding protein